MDIGTMDTSKTRPDDLTALLNKINDKVYSEVMAVFGKSETTAEISFGITTDKDGNPAYIARIREMKDADTEQILEAFKTIMAQIAKDLDSQMAEKLRGVRLLIEDGFKAPTPG